MTIRSEAPVFQILASKATGRNYNAQRSYRGVGSSFDTVELTPFLGDLGSIRTSKSLNEPCGGFSITFADALSNTGADSVYGLLEAQDLIEIRAGRWPLVAPFPGGRQRLIMRGYVSEVRRDETVGPDGTPQRSVTITGHDSAKLFFNWSVLPEAQIAAGQETMVSTFKLQASFGIAGGIKPVGDVVTQIITEMMNPRVAMLSNFSGWDIPEFVPMVQGPPEGQAWGGMFDSFMMGGGGRYWDLLEWVADRPWNELFVRDNPVSELPEVFFRPVPYRDTGGALIMPRATEPERIDRDIREIVSISMGHGDAKTANFFFVPPVNPQGNSMTSIKSMTLGSGGLGPPLFSVDHDNSNMSLYGLRKMMYGTRLYAEDAPEPVPPNSTTPAARLFAGVTDTNWHLYRANQLRLLNQDNSIWDSAHMVLKGSPDLLIGCELYWKRGQRRGQGFETRGYIAGVEHEMRPLRAGGQAHWLTNLTLERCNNYLERDAAGSSPRVTEGWSGPYLQDDRGSPGFG